jgi:hypothetical protein
MGGMMNSYRISALVESQKFDLCDNCFVFYKTVWKPCKVNIPEYLSEEQVIKYLIMRTDNEAL